MNKVLLFGLFGCVSFYTAFSLVFLKTSLDVMSVNYLMLNLKAAFRSSTSASCTYKCVGLTKTLGKSIQRFDEKTNACNCYVADELFAFDEANQLKKVVVTYERELTDLIIF